MSVVVQTAQACRAAILVCLIWIGALEAPQPPTSSHSPAGGGGSPSSASYFLNLFEDAAANLYKGYFTASGPDEEAASSTSFGATDAAKDRLVAAYVAVVVVEAVAMSCGFFEQHDQVKKKGRGGRQQGGLLLSTFLIGIGGYSRIPHILAAEATLLLIALVLASRKDHAARPNKTPRGGARGSDESGAFEGEASERELLRLASEDSPSAPPTSCIVVRVLQVRGLAGAVAGGSRSAGASVQVSARARLVGEGGSGVAGEWSETAEAGCIEGCATWEDEGGRVIALPVFRATRPALQVELVLLEHGDSPSLGSFGSEEEEEEKEKGREVGSWSGPISCLKGGCEWLPMSRGGEALLSCVQVGGEVGEGEGEGAVVFGRLWEVRPGADAVTFLDGGWCELEVCGRKRGYRMVGREGVVAWPSGHFSGVLVSSSPSLSTRSLDVVVKVKGLGVGNVSFPLTSLTSGGEGGGGGGGSWIGVARVQLGRGGAVAVLSVGAAWWSRSGGGAETCLGEENRRSSFLSANGTSSMLASPPPGAVTGAEVEAQGDGLDLSSIIAGTPRPSCSSNGGQAHADAQHPKYASVSVIRTYKDPHDGHVVYVCEVSILGNKDKWEIRRRFRDVLSLHSRIKSVLESHPDSPQPPPRVFMGGGSAKVVDARIVGISSYLVKALEVLLESASQPRGKVLGGDGDVDWGARAAGSEPLRQIMAFLQIPTDGVSSPKGLDGGAMFLSRGSGEHDAVSTLSPTCSSIESLESNLSRPLSVESTVLYR